MSAVATDARIRLATHADAEGVAAIYAPFVDDTAVTFELDPPGAAEMGARIDETLNRWPWLVCESGQRVAGYAYATAFRARPAYRWAVEVTVYVHEQHRGAGIGRALYATLLSALEVQGYYKAYAGITLPNTASVALHEAYGFERTGVYEAVGFKLGAWHDVGIWHKSLRVPAAEGPTEPVALPELVDLEGWQDALARGAASLRDRAERHRA